MAQELHLSQRDGLADRRTLRPYRPRPRCRRLRHLQDRNLDTTSPVRMHKGERIRVEGRVIDGMGAPIKDVLIEVWQANADGHYAHPEGGGPVEDGFRGWGRVIFRLRNRRMDL